MLGMREPSGKLQRLPKAKLEELNRAVVLDARQRLYGLSEDAAKQAEAEDILGRLYLMREISRAQYEAGRRYLEIVSEYRWSILAKGMASASDMDRQRGFDASDGLDPAYIERCRRAEEAYKRVRRAVLEAPDKLAMFILEAVVMERCEMPHQVGTLRIALNAVHHVVFGAKAA